MGLKKDDHIIDKIRLLYENGIDMHTQIVLCPGINDGEALRKTVEDLYAFSEHIVSLAVVPVGLTDHRFGLTPLKRVDRTYAAALLQDVGRWHRSFRREIGRGFVYPSDEFFIVAGQPVPGRTYYDGFPQIENGVGLTRSFLTGFNRQSVRFPRQLDRPRRLTLATGELAAGINNETIVPALNRVGHLDVRLEVVPNRLFGRNVTVAGLLSGKCLYSALQGTDCGDLLVLPPDILNGDGLFLDDATVPQLEQRLEVPIRVFDGRWSRIFAQLTNKERKARPAELLPLFKPTLSC